MLSPVVNMPSLKSLVALVAVTAQLASTQFVKPPTNFTTKTGYAGVQVRYKEVPAGICEMDPNVKSYSGYADVAPNQHIFWWFFESRNTPPSEAPLTVWINGGPGSSSMVRIDNELHPIVRWTDDCQDRLVSRTRSLLRQLERRSLQQSIFLDKREQYALHR